MVSLINFKAVSEELKQPTMSSKAQEEEQEVPTIKVVKAGQHDEVPTHSNPVEDQYTFQISQDAITLQDQKQDNNLQLNYDNNCNRSSSSEASNVEQLSFKSTGRSSDFHPSADSLVVAPGDRQNFVVTWRSLRYVIEPKWHQRVLETNPLSKWTERAYNALIGERKANIAGKLEQADQLTPTNKMVLDRLDGSFRSGELTAVLGPSGKLICHPWQVERERERG